MAKSVLTILLDYNKTMKKADELEHIANDIKNLANSNFNSTISKLKTNWTGDVANAYIQKANKVKEEMIKSADNVKKTADTLRNIAIRTYNTEMRNVQILSH